MRPDEFLPKMTSLEVHCFVLPKMGADMDIEQRMVFWFLSCLNCPVTPQKGNAITGVSLTHFYKEFNVLLVSSHYFLLIISF